MDPHTFSMRVPLAKDHWIWITSNRPLEVRHFRRLHQYLALQREIVGDEETLPELAGEAEG